MKKLAPDKRIMFWSYFALHKYDNNAAEIKKCKFYQILRQIAVLSLFLDFRPYWAFLFLWSWFL